MVKFVLSYNEYRLYNRRSEIQTKTGCLDGVWHDSNGNEVTYFGPIWRSSSAEHKYLATEAAQFLHPPPDNADWVWTMINGAGRALTYCQREPCIVLG